MKKEFVTQLLQLIFALMLIKCGLFEYAVILYLATILLELINIFYVIISKR